MSLSESSAAEGTRTAKDVGACHLAAGCWGKFAVNQKNKDRVEERRTHKAKGYSIVAMAMLPFMQFTYEAPLGAGWEV